MLNRAKMLSGIACVALAATACQPGVYLNQTSQGGLVGAAIGCVGILAFDPSTTASNAEDCVRGATFGALAGGLTGAYLESQETTLRTALGGTGAYVVRSNPHELRIVLPSEISFASGSSSLTHGARSALEKIADTLTAYPATTVYIDGHTDNRGGAASNMALSIERANKVKRYLVQHNVNKGRIVARGFGETVPQASNDTASGRAENRRVELRIRRH